MDASSPWPVQAYLLPPPTPDFCTGSGNPEQRLDLENPGQWAVPPSYAGPACYTSGQTHKPPWPSTRFSETNSYPEWTFDNVPSEYYDVSVPPHTVVSGTWNHDAVASLDALYPIPAPTPVPPTTPSSSHTLRRGSSQLAGPLGPFDFLRQLPISPSLRTEKSLSSSRVAPYSSGYARQSMAASGFFEPVPHRKLSTYENAPPSRGPAVRMSRAVHNKDWGKLAPGKVHVIVSNAEKAKFTSQATLRDFEQLDNIATQVRYAPRSTKYLSSDGRIINFSEGGIPAPYIEQLVNQKLKLDGGDEKVFEATGWRVTKLSFDWPGLAPHVEGMEVRSEGLKMSRDELAAHVAARIWESIRAVRKKKKAYFPSPDMDVWDLRTLNVHKLRLVSLNYYKTVWIPVLAIDV